MHYKKLIIILHWRLAYDMQLKITKGKKNSYISDVTNNFIKTRKFRHMQLKLIESKRGVKKSA